MKKYFVVGLIAVVVAVSGISAIAATSNMKSKSVTAQTKQMIDQKVQTHLVSVKDDLSKAIQVPKDFVVVQYTMIGDIAEGKNEAAVIPAQQRQQLARSLDQESTKLLTKGDWMPFYFVKPDASEFYIGIKKALGDNLIEHYRLENGQYVKVDSKTGKGSFVDHSVN